MVINSPLPRLRGKNKKACFNNSWVLYIPGFQSFPDKYHFKNLNWPSITSQSYPLHKYILVYDLVLGLLVFSIAIQVSTEKNNWQTSICVNEYLHEDLCVFINKCVLCEWFVCVHTYKWETNSINVATKKQAIQIIAELTIKLNLASLFSDK